MPSRTVLPLALAATLGAALAAEPARAQPAVTGPAVTGVSGGAHGPPPGVAVGPDSVVGALDPQWITVRGRGFGPGATARLRAPGVDASLSSEGWLDRVSDGELRVRASFGTEADRWTVAVTSGGETSAPYPFRVVPPRPVVHQAVVSTAASAATPTRSVSRARPTPRPQRSGSAGPLSPPGR